MILGDSTEVGREIHMNKGRVGEDRGSKETDGCPLTVSGKVNDNGGEEYKDNTKEESDDDEGRDIVTTRLVVDWLMNDESEID
jgi:hypothetical protein